MLAAISCLSVFTLAQTLMNWVPRTFKPKGGIDKIKAIKSVRITGKLTGGGGFTAAHRAGERTPNLVRETFALQA